MIFENESAIDSHLVSLAKKLKANNLENFSVGLDLKDNIWVITLPSDWLNSGLAKVTYYKFHKNPYRVWWEVEHEEGKEILMTADLKNVSQVINSLLLLRYKNQGVQSDVVAWLAKEALTKSLGEAVKRIAKETPFVLTMEEMKILGIEEQRGRITGRKFGL
jgi:hypothetical protein